MDTQHDMETLIEYQQSLMDEIREDFYRFLYPRLPWENRMLAIRGLRGAGKTTMLLQHLKYGQPQGVKSLYLTADHPWLYTHTLLDTAKMWVQNGGNVLYIDEVHKYHNWSRELKNIYDGFPKLKVFFTASSALDIYRGESDLSRRVLTFTLPGMSFREYLNLMRGEALGTVSLEQILQDPTHTAAAIKKQIDTPLPLFREYLAKGYLPFTRDDQGGHYLTRLLQVIDASISTDLAFIENYSSTHAVKIKKLMGVMAESAPFEPNISALAQKLQLGRDTVNNFLHHLERACLLNLVNRHTEGVAALQKPDKVYLENTNLSFALRENPDQGTIRETFFLNQMRNAGHTVRLPEKGDFLVDNTYTFEVGGRSKSLKQIAGLLQAYIVADDIELGFGNKLPLWLFGFLY